jgi:polyribonucleotide nucleotidyltransferase
MSTLPNAGIAIGLILEGSRYAVLSDILGKGRTVQPPLFLG